MTVAVQLSHYLPNFSEIRLNLESDDFKGNRQNNVFFKYNYFRNKNENFYVSL